MKKIKKLILIFLFGLFVSSCCSIGVSRKQINYEYETQALTFAESADGTIFLKSWGMDKKRKNAKEQARRNAIRTILFKGVPNSSVKRPLINEPGAEEKYREYFDRFFAKGGKYNQYIVQTSIDSKDIVKSGCLYRVGVKSKVYYRQLQKELVSAGITKKFGI